MVWLAMLWGCSGGPAECGPAECADVCARVEAPDPAPDADPAPAPATARMTDFEHELVDPMLEDLRAGVRPFNESGVGICKGKKDCGDFLGLEGGDLAPGDYMVRAELAVPKVGEKGTWTVEFTTECTYTTVNTNGETKSTKDYNREYDVIYAGEDRGYRLQPLRQIKSPTKSGAEEACTWSLKAPHPDGDNEWTGSWKVPAAG